MIIIKKKFICLLLSLSAILISVSFISNAFSFFSDIVLDVSTINSGNLSLSITDFTVGAQNSAGNLELHSKDNNHQFNTNISDGNILQISFVVKNDGTTGIDFNGTLDLSWLADANESNYFFLYPASYDNDTIINNIAANNDAGSIIGFDANDQNSNITSDGVQNGFAIPLSDADMALDTELPTNAKKFTYKLYFKDTKGDLPLSYQELNNAGFDMRVNLDATSSNTESVWNASTYDYGVIKTEITKLEPAVNITLNGDNPMYVDEYSEFVDPFATATDEYGNALTVTVEGEVNTGKVGTYVLTYTAKNGDLTKSVTRTVYVSDGEKPIITAKKSNVEKYINPSASLADLVTVTDNYDTEIASKLVIENPEGFDPEVPGVYDIVYKVTDSSGLEADPVTVIVTIFAAKDMKVMLDSTLILTTHGKVYAAGYNGSGQLGQGNTASNYYKFTKIKALEDKEIVQIGGSEYAGFALTSDGKVYSWGYGAYGTPGLGNTNSVYTPTLIPNLAGITKISMNYYTALALTDSGEVYSWGMGDYGANGSGSTSYKVSPSKIVFPQGTVIKDISMGRYQGYATTTDNQLYGWGGNDTYELISTSFGSYSTKPVNLTSYLPESLDVSKIKKISSGFGHAYILMEDGSTYAWGWNNNGQVGTGNTTNVSSPVHIPKFSDNNIKITDITAGYDSGLAADSNGILYAWGSNRNRMLGISTAPYVPTVVPSISDVVLVRPYYNHAGIITSKGYVYMVGYNAYGKLSDGTNASKTTYIKSIVLEDN